MTEDNAATPADAKAGRRRWRTIIIAVIVIAAAGFVAWRWYAGRLGYVFTDDATIDADRLSISSKMLGRIVTLTADEGDTVRSGQVLVQLDVSDLSAQQVQARANINLAEQNARLAHVNLDRAQQDLVRARVQFSDTTITAEQFQHAQNDVDAAAAKLSVAEAQIVSARAQFSAIDTSLRNATILAPMNGTVSKRWALPGDVVQAGQAILSIYNLDSVWVTANLEETKLEHVHVGDSVKISLDAYPHREFSGCVAQIGSSTASQFALIPPNNASGNFTKVTQRVPVRIAIDEESTAESAPLLPGMSAFIKIKI
jgi:membrane fusion protein (multidrug efflux system)